MKKKNKTLTPTYLRWNRCADSVGTFTFLAGGIVLAFAGIYCGEKFPETDRLWMLVLIMSVQMLIGSLVFLSRKLTMEENNKIMRKLELMSRKQSSPKKDEQLSSNAPSDELSP